MKFFIITEKNLKSVLSVLLIIFILSLNTPLTTLIKNIVTVEPSKQAVTQKDNILSVFFGYNYIMTDKRPNILLPFKENYIYDNGVFCFDINENLIVKSGANGIIKEIGYNENNEKYIKILHDGNIKSIYENVDIIGVNTNLKIDKNYIICTLKPNTKLRFYLTYNDELLTDYTIFNGEIIWKN